MRQTLPKSIILRGYQSFSNVITSGVSFQGTLLTGFVLTNTSERNISVGFSVPKKRVSLAVNRNRIKRLIREAVRKHIGEVISAAKEKNIGVEIVVMFKREKQRDIKRLTLHDIEPVWIEIQQQILKTL